LIEKLPIRAVITGGAGFIGFHLGKKLISMGWQVSLVDLNVPSSDDIEFHEFIQNDSVEYLQLDLTKNEQFKKLPDTDYVFHFAAYAAEGLSPFIRQYNYENNLVATARIINNCIK
jgi:UDP-glucose 4-epimerase